MRTGHRSYFWLGLRMSVLLILLLVLLLPSSPGRGQARSEPIVPLVAITVNSTGDQGDAYVYDGICDTAGKPSPPTPYSGICTLRAAI